MEHNTEHDTTPPESLTERQPSLRRRVGLVAAGLAFAVPIVGFATYGIAGADSAEDDPVEVVAEECDVETTPEDITASNEEEDALAAFLDERGIAYTNEPDEDGVRWVVWDEDDETANDAVDQFYAENYPLSPEDLAAVNEEEDALAAFLGERGIRHTRDRSATGIDNVVWDEHDEAADEAVGDFYAERYPLPDDLETETGSCVGMVEVSPG